MNPWRLRATLILLSLCAGCSRPEFSYSPPGTISMERFGTVALDPRTDMLLLMDGKRPVSAKAFQELVLREMADKGYSAVPPDQADLWIAVHALAESGSRGGDPRMDRAPMAGRDPMEEGGPRAKSGGAPPHGGARPEGPGGRDVTLVVELLERGGAQRIWIGSAEVPSQGPRPAQAAPPDLQAWIRRFLAPLPSHGIK